MAERQTNKPSKYERSYKILEYLRRNTDKENRVKRSDLARVPELREYLGYKETLNDTICNMALAMNTDSKGTIKPENEWKIIFEEFSRRYGLLGDNESLDEEDYFKENKKMSRMPIRHLYYQHTFSYDEINSIIEGILATKTIDSKTAHNLIDKIEKNLTSKFYISGRKQICKVQEPELTDRELLKTNLLTIQKAIDSNVQILFRFNGYTHKKKLEPIREKKDIVSPYYIVASNGKYYLLACKEVFIKGNILRNMSIWRIDLMTDIEIPDVNEKLNIMGRPRIAKEQVENLPLEWSEDFQLKHLNMSFDKPVWITLRIKSEKEKDNQCKRIRADYTFLHDWFGDNFRFIETEKVPPYDDIIKVECSPYGMVNWALQYSDRVEVIEPESVRKAVIEKIKNLNSKYRLR